MAVPVPVLDEEELIEISEEELAVLRRQQISVPAARGWSSPTFACHRNVSSCVLSCCCPCVQFGMNQRNAFGASCFKYALLWFVPLLSLYFLVNHIVPAPSAEEEVVDSIEHAVADNAAMEGSAPLRAVPMLDRETVRILLWPAAMVGIGIVGMLRRRALRERYNIGGTLLGDFVCHTLCHCCSLAKEAREIRRQTLDEVIIGAEQELYAPN